MPKKKASAPKGGSKSKAVVPAAPKEKRPVGAPSKYKPEYCNDLLDHMENGGSIESFGAYLARKYGRKSMVHKDTIYEWAKVHEEFSDAKRLGESLSLLWFEELGAAGMRGQLKVLVKELTLPDGTVVQEYDKANFGQAAWVFSMKNRHGWRDKKELVGPDGKGLFDNMSDEQLKAELESISQRLAIVEDEDE